MLAASRCSWTQASHSLVAVGLSSHFLSCFSTTFCWPLVLAGAAGSALPNPLPFSPPSFLHP